jgi:hypothetical protein
MKLLILSLLLFSQTLFASYSLENDLDLIRINSEKKGPSNTCSEQFTYGTFFAYITLEHRITVNLKFKSLDETTNELHKLAIKQSIDDNAFLIINRGTLSIDYYNKVLENCPNRAPKAQELKNMIQKHVDYAKKLREGNSSNL